MVEQTRPWYRLAGLALLIVCVRPGLEMMDASNPDDISDAGKSFDIQELVVSDLGLWLYFWGTHQTNRDTKMRTLRPQSVVIPPLNEGSQQAWMGRDHNGSRKLMAPHAPHWDSTWPTQGWAHRDHSGTTLEWREPLITENNLTP